MTNPVRKDAREISGREGWDSPAQSTRWVGHAVVGVATERRLAGGRRSIVARAEADVFSGRGKRLSGPANEVSPVAASMAVVLRGLGTKMEGEMMTTGWLARWNAS